ncbi:MAG: ester cyclase [Chloroflexi bacterium]|nr:MAG: ester cyclase [Chloroflexota bacterium]
MTFSQAIREIRERIVLEHMEAENALELDRALGTFAHPRYEIIGTGEAYDGPEEVERYYRESRGAFPDQRNEWISLRHADDAVIVEFWLLGTHEGRLRRLEPTGREFRCRMTAFFIFEGAELVCERVYFDSATILRQLTARSDGVSRS